MVAGLIASFAVLLGVSFSADARPPQAGSLLVFTDEEPTVVLVQRGPVSLSQARQMALQRFPGRVVRAETVTQSGNRSVHQIRVLDADGRVRNVRIDAQTGAFL